jgi:hypothetical protein
MEENEESEESEPEMHIKKRKPKGEKGDARRKRRAVIGMPRKERKGKEGKMYISEGDDLVGLTRLDLMELLRASRPGAAVTIDESDGGDAGRVPVRDKEVEKAIATRQSVTVARTLSILANMV